MQYSKTVTLEQFIEYRNKVVARARAVKFNKSRYYAIRLEQLDDAYPEFAKIGIIETAESQELSRGVIDKITASINNDLQDLNKARQDLKDLQDKIASLESSIQFKRWTLKK